jgi:hypothetical protein
LIFFLLFIRILPCLRIFFLSACINNYKKTGGVVLIFSYMEITHFDHIQLPLLSFVPIFLFPWSLSSSQIVLLLLLCLFKNLDSSYEKKKLIFVFLSLFHLAWLSPVSSIFQQMTRFASSSWLNDIPLCMCPILSLFIYHVICKYIFPVGALFELFLMFPLDVGTTVFKFL